MKPWNQIIVRAAPEPEIAVLVAAMEPYLRGPSASHAHGATVAASAVPAAVAVSGNGLHDQDPEGSISNTESTRGGENYA